MTVLRDHTAALLEAEMEHLGDEITYAKGEGGGSSTFNAWVVFDTDHINSPGSAATASAVSVEVLRRRVPNPSKSDRIRIKMRPGIIYAPTDIKDGATGDTFIIPVRKVAL